jgi:Kdo2-lipid IVA lauroyltransferase/acyltransferase
MPTGERTPAVAPSTTLILLSRLPLWLLHLLARAGAFLAPRLMRSRRQLVHENLERAFPALTDAARRELGRAFARNFADVVLESIKGYSISEAELNRRVRLTNLEVLERFVRARQSIVLVAAHEANWEWVFLACSSQLPFELQTVYKPLRGAAVDAFMHATRARFGAMLFTRKEFTRALLERRGCLRAIALLADERPSASDDCRWLRFLNQDTAFRTGFETLSRMWQYPVVFAARRRISRGHYEVTFELLGEPPYATQTVALVERYAEALQRSIEANPADWNWAQPRWSVRKPLYP